jgi:hypothetical protein
MKMTKAERAELDKCTALAKKIRAAERLGAVPAAIVLDASMLLTFERTMGGRRDQAPPSEVREVLELRLISPADYQARMERARPAAELYGLDAASPRR